jgi:hypothetical protein
LVRRETRGPLLSILAGCLIVAALIWGPSAYGVVTSGDRLSGELSGAGEPRDVVVSLSFRPQVFHVRELSRYGVFGGTSQDGSMTLLQVPPANLRALGQIYWIRSIDPATGPGVRP